MRHLYRTIFTLVAVIVAMIPAAYAQDNPYRVEEGWAKFPEGRKWGSTSGVDVDRDGNIWVFESCGANDLRRFEPRAYPQVRSRPASC